MRIGLLIEHFNPLRSSAEQWTCQFVRHLAARGHEVHVVTQSFVPSSAGLPLVAHPLGRLRSRFALAEAAEAEFRKLRLDVVHDNGAGWYCDVFLPHGGSRLAALEQNLLLLPPWLRPLKRRLYGLLPRYREFQALVERQYAAEGRIYIALSQRVAADFQRLHGLTPEQIRVIYNGVDTERFTPQRPARCGPPPVPVGPWRPPAHAVDRGAQFPPQGRAGPVAGDGAAEGPRPAGTPGRGRRKHCVGWARRAAALGLSRHVTFTGPVRDPAPLYAAADVYVQPTFYDPCSLVVLEALASGLPVITSRFNGAGELITPGREGYVLDDPADVDCLVEHLESLCDSDLRRQMADAARQLALRHSFARNVDELLGVYGEAAQRRLAA